MSKKPTENERDNVIQGYETKQRTLRELLDNKRQLDKEQFEQARAATSTYLKENKPLYDAAVSANKAEEHYRDLKKQFNQQKALAGLGAKLKQKDADKVNAAKRLFEQKMSEFKALSKPTPTIEPTPSPNTQLITLLEKLINEKDKKQQGQLVHGIAPLLSNISNSQQVSAQISLFADALFKGKTENAKKILQDIKNIFNPPQWVKAGSKEAVVAVKATAEQARVADTSPRGKAND